MFSKRTLRQAKTENLKRLAKINPAAPIAQRWKGIWLEINITNLFHNEIVEQIYFHFLYP